jgi:hypothetical protein
MTTAEFHERLRQHAFCKVGTGGGCDALVKHLLHIKEVACDLHPTNPNIKIISLEHPRHVGEIMLTAADDPSAPEADNDVQITVRMDGSDHEITWIASPQETLNFAAYAMSHNIE